MKMKLDGIGNPGWTFTDTRMEQLEIMFNYITEEKNCDSTFKYMELQSELEERFEDLNKNKVRMFFPWLYNYGVFNDYENIKTYGELYTEDGKAFAAFTTIYNTIKDKYLRKEVTEDKMELVEKVFEDFIFFFYQKILETPRGALYSLVIKTLKKYGYLTYNEFYILTHSLAHKHGEDWIKEQISLMRENEKEVKVEIGKNKNVYGYTIPFLKEAGIISEKNRVIYLEKKREL